MQSSRTHCSVCVCVCRVAGRWSVTTGHREAPGGAEGRGVYARRNHDPRDPRAGESRIQSRCDGSRRGGHGKSQRTREEVDATVSA